MFTREKKRKEICEICPMATFESIFNLSVEQFIKNINCFYCVNISASVLQGAVGNCRL